MAVPWISLGFGFGNLAMLGWLAAAAAPLLIHLWSRRRYREMQWAAMTFLLAAVRKHSRRIQLEQWLLLAVRTLLILLVVLAVAEPYGEQVSSGGFGVPTHRVLVIDTSFSMGYREGDTTRLALAQRQAAELVKGSGPADAFTIIALAAPPRQVIGRDLADGRLVAERIDSLVPSDGTANLDATLDLVAAALTLTPAESARFSRQEVTIFTDLQASTWNSATEANDGLRARIETIGEQATLVLVDVGSPQADNLAIVELQCSEPFITVDRPVTFDATLHEFGGEARAGCRVELIVDGTPVGEQTVDVPAGGESMVRFTHRFRTPGSHTVAVKAADDRLPIDNTRWLAVPVKEQVSVLCVGGATADARYLANALNPNPESGGPIKTTIITEGALAETDLANFDAVFLSNVAQLTSDESTRLARYVEQGGGLAVFLGDRVVPESYNEAQAGDAPLLPAQLGEPVAEGRFGLSPLEYRHPIVAPFRGRERAGLLSTPIQMRFELQVDKSAGDARTEVALATPGGEPLVVTAPRGSGRVVLVGTAGSMASVDAAGQPWTMWPAWPSFLPIVREILAYAIAGEQTAQRTIVGQPIAITNGTPGNAIEIVRPDGRKATASAVDGTSGARWSYADTDRNGIYTWRDAQGGEQFIAVNVDPRESDLATIDAGRLPAELQATAETGHASSTSGGAARAGWQRSLLWSALALVLVELGLAWRFGRGGGG